MFQIPLWNLPNYVKSKNYSLNLKKSQSIKTSNFRPITTVSVPEKVLDTAVYNELAQHFNSNHILTNYQSGFSHKHY